MKQGFVGLEAMESFNDINAATVMWQGLMGGEFVRTRTDIALTR